jgi:glycosyltransferase involved in cell wall biosynthesis
MPEPLDPLIDLRPLRILHVLPSLDQRYGGPLRIVLDLSAQAMELGMESEVVGLGALDAPDNPLSLQFIHQLPGDSTSSFAYSSALRPWLRSNLKHFDGVVLHGVWTYVDWAAAQECRSANVPYVQFPHGMLEPWAVRGQGGSKFAKKFLYWWFRQKKVCENARFLLFTTQRERELTMGLFAPHTGVKVLPPYGVNAFSREPATPDRSDLQQPTGTKVALFLGRVHPKKNLDFLIEAWGRARPSADWRLIVAGPVEHGYRSILDRQIARWELGDQVSFVGFVSAADKDYLLQRADWFLLPSRQENFGVAVLEAMSQGCAVAISDQVYLAESFCSSAEVLPVSIDAWIEFIHTRMPDGAWRNKRAEEDREYLLREFETSRIAQNWVNSFQTMFRPSQQ